MLTKTTRSHTKVTQFIFGKETVVGLYDETNSESCYSCIRFTANALNRTQM